MRIAQFILAVFTLALVGIGPMQSKPQSAEAAIKARADAFAAAWDKHDGKAMAACWATDGDLIDPFGQTVKGRADLEKFFQSEQAGWMKTTTYNLIKHAARMLGADVAVADWDVDITGMKTPEGADAPPLKHHVTVVLKHEGGEWMFVAARPVIYAVKPAPPQPH